MTQSRAGGDGSFSHPLNIDFDDLPVDAWERDEWWTTPTAQDDWVLADPYKTRVTRARNSKRSRHERNWLVVSEFFGLTLTYQSWDHAREAAVQLANTSSINPYGLIGCTYAAPF